MYKYISFSENVGCQKHVFFPQFYSCLVFFWFYFFILYTKNEGKQEIIKYWKISPSQALEVQEIDKPNANNNSTKNKNERFI